MNDQMAPYRRPATAVVITTAMLSFISCWRAASLVLCDLASTAYYIGGIVEQSIGKAAPWFIAFIMLFANGVRATYVESCGMFVRAGVYRVVKVALGGTVAKLSVSALIFDYILTGPISSVAAGQYLIGFLNDLFVNAGIAIILPRQIGAMMIALVITAYFWRKNVIGIHESSDKALKIMSATAITVLILVGWCALTLFLHPQPLPPIRLDIHPHALGWLRHIDWLQEVGAVGIIIAISHSVLAMSGEETLAQVYREIAKPKLTNMKRAAIIVFAFSFLFTAVCSFFAVMIIPDAVRPHYYDNLMAGLTMYLTGPHLLKLAFQGVVVIVGVFILAGACNTALIGANGILNRVAEDGVLPQWLRAPHTRFGTTARVITLVAMAQVMTIILCRGNIYLLGEAYAFGVIWSFVTGTFAVLVLRFKDRSPREWKVPGNIRIGTLEIPIGLFLISFCLFVIGLTNFFTKTVATTWGMAFVAFFFTVLVVSERHQRKRAEDSSVERVNVKFEETLTPAALGLEHDNRVLIAARDPANLYHLRATLERLDPKITDIVVVIIDRLAASGGETNFEGRKRVPAGDEKLLTHVVSLAERYGTHIIPLVVPAVDPTFAIAKIAYEIGAQEIILGRSEAVAAEVQLERMAFCWGYLAVESGRKVVVRVVWPQHELKHEVS